MRRAAGEGPSSHTHCYLCPWDIHAAVLARSLCAPPKPRAPAAVFCGRLCCDFFPLSPFPVAGLAALSILRGKRAQSADQRKFLFFVQQKFADNTRGGQVGHFSDSSNQTFPLGIPGCRIPHYSPSLQFYLVKCRAPFIAVIQGFTGVSVLLGSAPRGIPFRGTLKPLALW
jgi:hypothetical protein